MIYKLQMNKIKKTQDQVILTSEASSVVLNLLMNMKDQLFSGDSLEVDFSDIALADSIFLDQTIIQFTRAIIENKKKRDIVIFLSHVNSEVKKSLEFVIATYQNQGIRIPILIKDDQEFSITGHLENYLRETFEGVQFKGKMTTRDLCDWMKIKTTAANNRLKKIYDLGLVHRREICAPNGKPHEYFLPH